MTRAEKVKQVLDKWNERISIGLAALSGFLMVIMAFVSTYGATLRYFFKNPEPYSYEFCEIFMLLSFVLAIAAVERQDRFIRCDMLIERFPKNVRDIILDIIGPIMGITFFGIITWVSYGDALRGLLLGQTTTSAFPVPLFPIKIFIPIGYGYLCFVLAVRLVFGLLHLKTMWLFHVKPSLSEPQSSTDRQ